MSDRQGHRKAINEHVAAEDFIAAAFDKIVAAAELQPCNGLCVTATEVGLPEYGFGIVYAHPECSVHGSPV